MDPYHNQRDTRDQLNSSRDSVKLRDTSATPGGAPTPEDPLREAPDSRTPQATPRQPQYSSGYHMIPPNEARRRETQMIAQKGEETFQKWKEANRPTAVHLTPETLGGNVTEAEARARQFKDLRCSKIQKKLKKEELDKKRRQEEEEENQRKKDKQREMAERWEEKRRQEDERRREQFGQDHVRKTEKFLQRFERSGPPVSSSATHTSSRSEAMETQQRQKESKSVRDQQLEHRRVNLAFLDRLEGQGRRSEKETQEGGFQGEENPVLAPEDFRHQPSNQTGQQPPLAHLTPDPEQSYSGWTEESDSDFDWALMKLMNSFPYCDKDFLEGILKQCGGDYEQAYALLNCN
ncbi:epithelial-stromal interaction protein 1 isoform X3 [Epinephelus fuscoguttatus]|uniref:epithelial-stromal interaction protein 1 isoform X3 n=1 Tax=Epinephelus fuscoguttatus TaxID=293821 RepID=UPI0020D0DC5B|nr:epithelial-stromal interaction protein 1 isoform X3 [Epinephelus fuscoguttatus]